MPENYILLERTELNASAASVTFANIPQTGYTDLKIVMSSRTDGSGVYLGTRISFNGSTSNFSSRDLYGTGSATGSGNSSSSPGGGQSVGYVSGTSTTASTFSNNEFYIPNYTSSNAKSISSDFTVENNATSSLAGFVATLWNPSTQAGITSITIAPDGANWVSGSTFSLYGIAAVGTTPVIAPKASGGNIIDFDGTYWIHTFTSSGTFTPLQGLSCDVLVVAGGGGGAYYYGSGGGAGGLLEQSARSLTLSTNYAVTIGAGGAKSPSASSANNKASNGTNSTFDTITAIGGGGGNGGISNSNATNTEGGSSGGKQGGSQDIALQGNSGGATGYGFKGSVDSNGGGGGGASADGSGTNGGNGRANSITGTSITYAGGGGGTLGSNGTGGGPTANRGGGGKGDTENGGSGIVIIRYPAA